MISFAKCNGVDKEMSKLRPTQTYQCDFHDKPLVLVGWHGKMAIRRYKMKDLERGTIIPGIRHYARKCKALPLHWEKGAKEKRSELNKEYKNWSWLIVFLIIMIFVVINASEAAVEALDKEYENEKMIKWEEQEKERIENRRQIRLEHEKKRQQMIQHSEKVRIEREERKRKKREMYEANRLRNIEKRKKRSQS